MADETPYEGNSGLSGRDLAWKITRGGKKRKDQWGSGPGDYSSVPIPELAQKGYVTRYGSPQKTSRYRDPYFIPIFVGGIITLAYFAFKDGIQYYEEVSNLISGPTSFDGSSTGDSEFGEYGPPIFIGVGISVIIPGLFLVFVGLAPKKALAASFFLVLLLLVSLLIALLFFDILFIPPTGIVVAIVAVILIYGIIYYRARKNIAFVKSTLSLAMKGLRIYPSLIAVNMMFLVLNVLYFFILLSALFGLEEPPVSDSQSDIDDIASTVILLLFIFAFFVGNEYFKNSGHVVTTSVLLKWAKTGTVDAALVRRRLRTVLGPSLGSVIFGSFFTGMVETVRYYLTRVKDTLTCGVGLLGLVSLFNQLIVFFNRYAFVYVGAYHLSYAKAAKYAFEMFARTEILAVADDYFIEGTLGYIKYLTAFVTALSTYLSGLAFDVPGELLLIETISTGLFAYVVSNMALSLISGAVVAIFIGFTEDPYAMFQSHPKETEEIYRDWYRLRYPLLVAAGYADPPRKAKV